MNHLEFNRQFMQDGGLGVAVDDLMVRHEDAMAPYGGTDTSYECFCLISIWSHRAVRGGQLMSRYIDCVIYKADALTLSVLNDCDPATFTSGHPDCEGE